MCIFDLFGDHRCYLLYGVVRVVFVNGAAVRYLVEPIIRCGREPQRNLSMSTAHVSLKVSTMIITLNLRFQKFDEARCLYLTGLVFTSGIQLILCLHTYD